MFASQSDNVFEYLERLVVGEVELLSDPDSSGTARNCACQLGAFRSAEFDQENVDSPFVRTSLGDFSSSAEVVPVMIVPCIGIGAAAASPLWREMLSFKASVFACIFCIAILKTRGEAEDDWASRQSV